MSRFKFTPRAGHTEIKPGSPLRPTRIPVGIRPEWQKPEPPSTGGPWLLSVYDSGDGWHTHWANPDGECIDIVGDEGWPFIEDFARASDWEGIGFDVV